MWLCCIDVGEVLVCMCGEGREGGERRGFSPGLGLLCRFAGKAAGYALVTVSFSCSYCAGGRFLIAYHTIAVLAVYLLITAVVNQSDSFMLSHQTRLLLSLGACPS